ncbi:MAG TPA: hypothetical protein VFB67_01545 [Candidatus Polarisedimenticolaceae bacterium]|nr:hypothetical protein [Candidatus Polarisedimenticolaceae bacterium]
MRNRTVRIAVLASLLTVASAVSAPPTHYRATRIPGIPEQGFNNVFPSDINNHGVIVGTLSRLPGFVPVRAFLWNGSGPTQDLGDLGVFEFAQAIAVNESAEVVGMAEVLEPRSSLGTALHGFYWKNGVMTDLPPLGNDLDSQALAITELGEVLVVSYDPSDRLRDRYYIWKNGHADQIGRLNAYPGGPSAFAGSMNDARQIVGSVINADGQERAFLWQGGQLIDLGLAPGDDFFSVANKITNSGLIIGQSWAFDANNGHGSRAQGVVWQGASFVRTIPPLAGDWASAAIGTNGTGTIVGYSGFPSSAIVSFGGAAINLNDLVPGNVPETHLYQGTDVNEAGQITVDGQFGCCGYRLDPQ